jgi:DMSO/TMAO reductase YedYZ molybdopterin-dependent catalytic subunit
MTRRSATAVRATRACCAAISLAVSVALQAQSPQPAPAPNATLTIAGDIPKTVTLAVTDLKTYPRTTVAIQEEGRTVTYEGVLLAEFTGSQIIIADTIDGKPLFDYQGPVRIVAPGDKRGARSIRMLERLEVVRLRK